MSKRHKKNLLRIIIAAVIFAAGLFIPEQEELFTVMWFIRLEVFLASYFTVGWDIVWKAVRNIAHGQVLDENFLMTIASVGAMIIGEYSEGVAVMIFYQVGELFQSVAVGKSRRNISEMININPEYANVERDGEITEVDPEDVQIGETVVVKPGEKVPLDGVVIFGASGLNTSALTGESALREVAAGDDVISGCINTNGLLKIRVSRPYSDSTVAKILELVENSSANKAKTENFITRFARVYTPIVVVGAVLLAIVPPLLLGGLGSGEVWKDWIYRALTFLVVSCPCALVISVPLSYFGGIGGASRHGIMIKGANYLEALYKAKTYVFDKTGTLTKGSFAVSEIVPKDISKKELLAYCAAAERFSNHPIADSIVKAAEAEGEIPAAENAEELAGYGVKAVVEGRNICVGNARLMQQLGTEFDAAENTGTVVHASIDGKYAGYLIISDELKEGAADAVSELKRLGAQKTVMLTGDRKITGESVAAETGIDECFTELLPDGKVAKVEELYEHKPENSTLVYIGDGMNDAPSLARADVGIAMGGLGSDAAIEAADIVLMNDNISKLATTVKIARKTHFIVMENIIFALGVKILILLLTAFGFANMWAAVFGDVGVAVIAILNAMRAMGVKKL